MKQTRIISAALAAAMLLTLTACQSGSGSEDNSGSAPPAGVAVQVQEVAVDTIANGSSISGQVTSDDGTESVFVSAQARCTAVYVEVGDDIRAGAPICRLDMDDTLASLETASTNYNNTLKSYQDQEALFDTQIAQVEKTIQDTQKTYQDQEELFDSQIALAEKTIQDATKSYQDQEALFNSQIALAEKNLSDLKALMEIGAASQAEIDQAELNLSSLRVSKSATLTQLEQGIENAQSSIHSLQVSKSSTLTQLEQGMDSARTNIQSLETSKSATLDQLAQGMDAAQINLDQLRKVMENVDAQGNVIAPISGTILSLNASKNSYVAPTAPVAVIDGVARMEISVFVSEALIPRLNLRDEVDVAISALDVTVIGTIQEIEDKANPQTKLYEVTIGLVEPLDGLRVGMFVDVSFRTEVSSDTIVIPTEAILSSNEEQYVFVVENGAARSVPVTTGLTGNGVTEITQGLKAGDKLVTVGQSYLTDGAAVRIVSGEG